MLQKPDANDYGISTGGTHSIREFLDIASQRVGTENWDPLVKQDPRFFRPAEVELLIGDAPKARAELGLEPTVSFPALVAMVADADVSEQRRYAASASGA
jgi:GDPmannose 4,6-dehydratase